MSNQPTDPDADTVLAAHESDSRFELGSLDLSDERPEHGLGDGPRSRKVVVGLLTGGVVTVLLMVGVLRGRSPSIEPAAAEAESPVEIDTPSHTAEVGPVDASDAAAASPQPASAPARVVAPASLTAATVSPRAPVRDEPVRPSQPEREAAVLPSTPAPEAGPAGRVTEPARAEPAFGNLPSLGEDEAPSEHDGQPDDPPEPTPAEVTEDPPATPPSEPIKDEQASPSASPTHTEEPAFAPDDGAPEDPRA